MSVTMDELELEQRIARIDVLLCILFKGLVNHPLATTMVPPAELEQLKKILPPDV